MKSCDDLSGECVDHTDGDGFSVDAGLCHSSIPMYRDAYTESDINEIALQWDWAPLQGSVSSIQMVMASALVLGCATASVTLWYFSRRYVGELTLLKGGRAGRPSRLCFSVLDFWGNREVCPYCCTIREEWHTQAGAGTEAAEAGRLKSWYAPCLKSAWKSS